MSEALEALRAPKFSADLPVERWLEAKRDYYRARREAASRAGSLYELECNYEARLSLLHAALRGEDLGKACQEARGIAKHWTARRASEEWLNVYGSLQDEGRLPSKETER